jgi:hypothetical protein
MTKKNKAGEAGNRKPRLVTEKLRLVAKISRMETEKNKVGGQKNLGLWRGCRSKHQASGKFYCSMLLLTPNVIRLKEQGR